MKERTTNCPPWCERQHPAELGPYQVCIPHQNDVATRTLIDGTMIDVVVSWSERLDEFPSTAPEVVLYTHTEDETAAVELAPGAAGMLAEVMALAGVAGWLGEALAAAAALLGYSPYAAEELGDQCETAAAAAREEAGR